MNANETVETIRKAGKKVFKAASSENKILLMINLNW
jgi:hypothetical protein